MAKKAKRNIAMATLVVITAVLPILLKYLQKTGASWDNMSAAERGVFLDKLKIDKLSPKVRNVMVKLKLSKLTELAAEGAKAGTGVLKAKTKVAAGKNPDDEGELMVMIPQSQIRADMIQFASYKAPSGENYRIDITDYRKREGLYSGWATIWKGPKSVAMMFTTQKRSAKEIADALVDILRTMVLQHDRRSTFQRIYEVGAGIDNPSGTAKELSGMWEREQRGEFSPDDLERLTQMGAETLEELIGAFTAKENPISVEQFEEAIAGEGWAIVDYIDLYERADTEQERGVIKHILGEEREHLKELLELRYGHRAKANTGLQTVGNPRSRADMVSMFNYAVDRFNISCYAFESANEHWEAYETGDVDVENYLDNAVGNFREMLGIRKMFNDVEWAEWWTYAPNRLRRDKMIHNIEYIRPFGGLVRKDRVFFAEPSANCLGLVGSREHPNWRVRENPVDYSRIRCNECGHIFSRKIGPRTFEIRCPKCKGYDTEPAANPRKGAQIRGKYEIAKHGKWVRERLAPKEDFDPRSFRTVRSGRHLVVIGCPKGRWDEYREHCKVGTRGQALLHPIEMKGKFGFKNPIPIYPDGTNGWQKVQDKSHGGNVSVLYEKGDLTIELFRDSYWGDTAQMNVILRDRSRESYSSRLGETVDFKIFNSADDAIAFAVNYMAGNIGFKNPAARFVESYQQLGFGENGFQNDKNGKLMRIHRDKDGKFGMGWKDEYWPSTKSGQYHEEELMVMRMHPLDVGEANPDSAYYSQEFFAKSNPFRLNVRDLHNVQLNYEKDKMKVGDEIYFWYFHDSRTTAYGKGKVIKINKKSTRIEVVEDESGTYPAGMKLTLPNILNERWAAGHQGACYVPYGQQDRFMSRRAGANPQRRFLQGFPTRKAAATLANRIASSGKKVVVRAVKFPGEGLIYGVFEVLGGEVYPLPLNNPDTSEEQFWEQEAEIIRQYLDRGD